MSVRRIHTWPLLRPEDLAPSDDRFEVVGVFNPGAVRTSDEVVLLVRVADDQTRIVIIFLVSQRGKTFEV